MTMCMTSYPPLPTRTIRIMGHEVEARDPDDLEQLRAAIRQSNTVKIQAVLRSLEPQIDGSYGPVNPRLIEVYFKGLAEIAKLYGVYAPPKPKPEEQTPDREAAVLRATAEQQLRELAQRAAPESSE